MKCLISTKKNSEVQLLQKCPYLGLSTDWQLPQGQGSAACSGISLQVFAGRTQEVFALCLREDNSAQQWEKIN